MEIFLVKRKNKAETDSLTTNTYKTLLSSITEEMERMKEKDIVWETLLNEERSNRKLAHQRNLRYHSEIKALQVELALLKQALAVYNPSLIKTRVFIVDDMPYVLDLFRARLGTNALIDLSTFATAREFLAALEHKPSIVVLDYDLDNHLTAEDIIRQLKDGAYWYPKIIVVTGHPVDAISEKLDADVWRVYSKDGAYVVEVSAAIMDYIREVAL